MSYLVAQLVRAIPGFSHKWFFALFFVFYATNNSFAASLQTLSLKDAIFLALRYNPNIQNSQIQRIIDKYALKAANYEFEFQFSLKSSLRYHLNHHPAFQESDTATITPTASLLTPLGTQLAVSVNNAFNHAEAHASYYHPAVNLSLTQPLLRGFGSEITLAPLYNARDQELSNQLIFKNQIIQTITEVINQYVQWIQAKSALKTQQRSLDATIKTLAQYRDLIKAGRSAKAGIVQFEVDVANAKLSVQQQQIAVQQAHFALVNLLGLNPDYLITAPAAIEVIENPLLPLTECVTLGLKFNVAYQQALINIRILKRALSVAEDNTRPQLNLTATHTQDHFNNQPATNLFNSRNRNSTIELNLDIPIDNVPLKQAAMSASIQLKQAATSLQAQRRQLISDITTTYQTLVIQKEQIKQSRQAMQLADQNIEIANLKLKLGKITPFEVSSQRLAVTNAQLAYINSRINFISTLAVFEQLMGTTLNRWKIKLSY